MQWGYYLRSEGRGLWDHKSNTFMFKVNVDITSKMSEQFNCIEKCNWPVTLTPMPHVLSGLRHLRQFCPRLTWHNDTHLIFSVKLLVSLVRHGVVRISHICAVFPVDDSACNKNMCQGTTKKFYDHLKDTWVLLDSSWLVGSVLEFWDSGKVVVSLNIY